MPSRTTNSRSTSHCCLVAALATVGLAAGCASPGPPKPPSLNLPKPVANLTAERVANTVLLRWTTPDKTTDNLDVKAPLTAEICRDPGPPPTTSACIPVLKLTVEPGETQVTDTLPQDLTAGPDALLTYRVRILSRTGHAAAPSTPAFAVAGAAPVPVTGLHATSVPAGAMLEWQPQPAEIVELDRVDLNLVKAQASASASATKAPAEPQQPKPASTKSNKSNKLLKPESSLPSKPKPAATVQNQPSTEIHLSAATNDPSRSGGTIDRTVHTGDTYTYMAWRVRTVTLAGHPLRLRSDASTAITFGMRDTFPPAVPTGLATVANPVSETNNQPSIDLSWEPDADADLAGYLVYRRSAGEPPDRLTPTPITASAFRDLTAAAGRHYTYWVTAIDVSGNESKPAAEAQEQINP